MQSCCRELQFPYIVISTRIISGPLNTPKSLRIFFIDNSFLEIWIGAIEDERKKPDYNPVYTALDGKLKINLDDNYKKHKELIPIIDEIKGSPIIVISKPAFLNRSRGK